MTLTVTPVRKEPGILWYYTIPFICSPTALVTQIVKNLPAVQETRVQSLSREDLLEKGKATHSSILAWKIPQREEPDGLQSKGSQRIGQD